MLWPISRKMDESLHFSEIREILKTAMADATNEREDG